MHYMLRTEIVYHIFAVLSRGKKSFSGVFEEKSCNRKSLPHSGREFKTQIGLPIAMPEPGDTIFVQDTNRYEIAFVIRERRERSSKYKASLR